MTESSTLPPAPGSARRWPWVVGMVIGAALVIGAARALDWRAIGSELARARPGWVALALAAYVASILLWSRLWQSWAASARVVPWRRMWSVNTLLLLGANTLPFFGGHALGISLLVRREGLPLAAALSVLAVDQLLEGFAKAAVLLLVAVLVPLPGWLTAALAGIGSAVGVGLILLLWAAWHWPSWEIGRRARGGVIGRVSTFASEWAAHLDVLRDGGRFAHGLLGMLLCKAAELAAIYAVQRALGVPLPFVAALLVLGATQVAGMIPVSPGNLGVYEAAAYWAYTSLGVAPATALGLALLQHACYLAVAIGPGLALLGWRAARGTTLEERA